MKFIITTFVLLNCNFLLHAQKKKDNTIVVHGRVDYSSLKNALINENLIPLNSDTSFILTNTRSVSTISKVGYTIRKTDSLTFFKGNVTAIIDGTSVDLPIDYTWGTTKLGFDIINRIAKSFGYPITYHREK